MSKTPGSMRLSDSQIKAAERIGLRVSAMVESAQRGLCVSCGEKATKGAVSVVYFSKNGLPYNRIYTYGLCEECDPLNAALSEVAQARDAKIRASLGITFSPN